MVRDCFIQLIIQVLVHIMHTYDHLNRKFQENVTAKTGKKLKNLTKCQAMNKKGFIILNLADKKITRF